MKNVASIIALIVLSLNTSNAQFNYEYNQGNGTLVLNASSGINNMGGLAGIGIEKLTQKNLAIMGAAGVGLWGLKSSIGLKYYKYFPYKTHIGLYYSYASGFDNMLMSLSCEGYDDPQEVNLQFTPSKNANIIIGYNWELFYKVRFYFDLGYAIPVNTASYKVKSDHTLTEESINFMDMLIPGGIILGGGFSYSF